MKPIAWRTEDTDGVPYLWHDLAEARLYCDEDEEPTALYAMTNATDIHSCSQYCDKPACVKAQRDQMRDELARLRAVEPVAWKPEWAAFVEYWTHESHLQTFADRERFREAAKAMFAAPPAQPDWVDAGNEASERIDKTLSISRVTVGMPAADYATIKAYADGMGIIPRALVRRILEEWVNSREGGDAPPAQPAEPDGNIMPLVDHLATMGREADAAGAFEPAQPSTHISANPALAGKRLTDEQIDSILQEAGVDEFAAIPIEYDRQVARAIESALQPQGWRCQIAEADFERNTVTLLMAGDDYQVSAGPHMLVPLLPLPPRAME